MTSTTTGFEPLSISVPSSTTTTTSIQETKDQGAQCHVDLKQFYTKMEELSTRDPLSREIVSQLSQVSMTDSNEDLEMYCYNHGLYMDVADGLTQECRGIVYDTEGKIVSRSFGYTPMYHPSILSGDEPCPPNAIPEDVESFVSENFEGCEVFPAFEGALLRAFNHKGKWYLTTHRKLDAFKSFWGCRTSFGDMFLEALSGLCLLDPVFAEMCPEEILLESFFELLNPKRQYMFLVLNTSENRIVCIPPKSAEETKLEMENEEVAYDQYAPELPFRPHVLHVATFEDGVMIPNEYVYIPQQTPIKFGSFQQLREDAMNLSAEYTQGYIIFMPNGHQIKICSPQYLHLFALRGNESSVMFRYLQIRMTQAAEFVGLYPEYAPRIDLYEQTLQTIAQSIYGSYKARFIEGQQVVLPKEEFGVMSQVHEHYKRRRASGTAGKTRGARVNVEDVMHALNFTATPTALNKMIRRVLDAQRAAEKAAIALTAEDSKDSGGNGGNPEDSKETESCEDPTDS